MALTNPSPNMILPVPVVGVDPGPDWANNINNCLAIIDQHNHAPGSGVQINPDGININADLAFNNNNLITARSLRLQPQGAPLALASDLGCLYESGVDLYYNDGIGNQIRITQSGNVTGATGTITGLPSGTASASFAAGTFTFQAATLTPANIDGGSFILRNNIASSKGLTLSPPNAMGADFGITLPSLPGTTLPVSISPSGTMAAAQITFAQLDSSTQAKITGTAPTVQKFLSGSGTYTTPVSPAPLYIKVLAIGAGGSSNGGGAGTDTTFGTSLIVAGGGGGGSAVFNGLGGTGGTASLGSGPIGLALSGTRGGNGAAGGSATAANGGSGGNSPFLNGGGQEGDALPGTPNTGGGGSSGQSINGGPQIGGGGGGGGGVSALISSPLSTYAYTIGVGGTGGSADGGSGIIVVEEYYQ